ncbi:MAG: type 4a pilus biogenesis protein PilO [Sulfurospirillum sp.]|nr:type 4a pilus biogenesis protein PilO [Sulfurospirillum sp.]
MNSFMTYMQNADIKQKFMIYASVLLVSFMLLNQFLPSLIEKQESLESEIASMQMEIVKNSAKRLSRDLAQTKELQLKEASNLEALKERSSFLMANLYKVKFAFFAEKELARALNDLLKESLQKNIQINFIKNTQEKKADISELIGYKKTMIIDGNGSYMDTLKFIHYIENLELLMDIDKISLTQDTQKGGVKFEIIIHMYGVGL